MFKKIIFISFFTLFSPLIIDPEEEWSLGAGWEVSYLDGLFNEIVYQGTGSTEKLSHLYWDIEELLTAGPVFDFSYKWFKAEFSLSFPVTEGTGSMEDYDWENGYDSGYTKYSYSTVDIKEFTALDLFLAANIYREWLYASISAEYLHIRWEDTPVSYDYPSGSGTFEVDNAINYDFNSASLFPGIMIYKTLPRDIDTGLKLSYSPLSKRYTIDEHVLRDFEFTDIFSRSQVLKINFELNKKWNNLYYAGLKTGFVYYLPARGDTVTRILSSGDLYSVSLDSAGSNAFYWKVSLLFGYIF